MQTTTQTAYPRGLGPVAGFLDWCGALGALGNRAVAGFLAWAEDLITEINGPALIMCGVVAVIALMSGGALFASWDWLLVAWPAAQAVGVDIMVLVAVRYAVKLFLRFFAECRENGLTWGAVPYALLGSFWGGVVAALASVIYTANRVFGYQLMTGASESDALTHYGITPDGFIGQRSAVLVGLIVLSAIVLALKQMQVQQPATHSAMAVGRAEGGKNGPVSDLPTVRIPATPAPNKRVAVAVPAYASYRTDQQLAALNPEWERLARAYCADKPEIGGKKLAAYLASQLGEENAPSKSKAQELARMFRPAVLKLSAGRPALA